MRRSKRNVELMETLVEQVLGPTPLNETATRSTLQTLDEIRDDASYLLPKLMALLRSSNHRVRSKAVGLIGRVNQNPDWIRRLMLDPDARVRANLVESLWGTESAGVQEAFWAALKDESTRVSTNALVGLYRIGEAAVFPLVNRRAADSAPELRAAAAWAMGETGDPRFLPVLTQLLLEREGSVRRNAFRAIGRVKQRVLALQSGEALELKIVSARRDDDGSTRLHVSICQAQPGELDEFKATEFVLWENSSAICDYRVGKHASNGRLMCAFAAPTRQGLNEDQALLMDQAVGECLEIKRKEDRWATVSYSPQSEGGSLEPETVPDNDTPQAPEVTGGSPDQWKNKERLGLPQAIESLTGQNPELSGTRHLFILDDCWEPVKGLNPDQIHRFTDRIVRRAAETDTTIHCVTRENCCHCAHELIERLCSRTGGVYSVVKEDRFVASTVALYRALLRGYVLEYRSAAQASQPIVIKLQVVSDQGLGQDAMTIPTRRPARAGTAFPSA